MSDEAAVIVPAEVKATIETRITWARALVIRSPAERDEVMSVVREVKGLIREIDAKFEKSCDTAHKAWKEAVALRDSFRLGPAEIERLGKSAVVKWDQDQEAKRIAEQRRRRAIADEQARKEREKIEAAARAQREKEEAARRAEEEARRKAAEATNEQERKRLEAEAEKRRREATAAAAKAEAKEETASAVQAPVVTVAPTVQKAAGESKSVRWKARVVDSEAFIRAAVAAGRFEFITIDEVSLNAFARKTAGKVKLTGIEFYPDTTMSVRG